MAHFLSTIVGYPRSTEKKGKGEGGMRLGIGKVRIKVKRVVREVGH
jgi:hypothetical protein